MFVNNANIGRSTYICILLAITGKPKEVSREFSTELLKPRGIPKRLLDEHRYSLVGW